MRNKTISALFENASENANNKHTGFEVITDNPQPKLRLNSMDERLASAPVRYAVADIAVRFKRFSPASTKTKTEPNQMYLSEELIQCETWRGRVLCVSKNDIEMEITNDKFHDIKRTLRVSKAAVQYSNCAYVGSEVSVSFKKVRGYRGRIKERTTVVLNRPVEIPLEVKELRHMERMQKYAFMFKPVEK